jgi:hypothetical protein
LEEYEREARGDGTKREFFVKLFDELFCDDEHPKRPFILPEDNIANRYYINPNFEPDEKFRKVIEHIRKKQPHKIPTFDTDTDYEYIYEVIGKLLCIAVVNEDIGLPRQLSSYIFAGFINDKDKDKDKKYDILYYYLHEFNNAISYINWISTANIGSIDDDNFELAFNDYYDISRTSQGVKKSNYILFILKLANHVIRKNFLGKDVPSSSKSMKNRYDSLFKGFRDVIGLGNFLDEKQVSVKMLSLLITNEELTVELLQEFARKIVLNTNADTQIKFAVKRYISNIITNPSNIYGTHEEHLKFIKKLLQFWTSLNYYNKNIPYEIVFKYGNDASEYNRYPEAHTCYYQLVISGFPPPATLIDRTLHRTTLAYGNRERWIYDRLKEAVKAQVMDIY